MNIEERRKELGALLKDKGYRDAFVEASLNIGVPSQIRTLRKQREWTQKKLADEARMLQESISRIEDPTRGSVNLKTLLKLASAFDLGLIVRFVPFGEIVDWKLKLSLESLEAESFEQDAYFIETPEPSTITDTEYSAVIAAQGSAQLYKIENLRDRQKTHISMASSDENTYTGRAAHG